MSNLVTGIIGTVMVAIFLGIMLVWVPAIPLILICVGVMALLVVDFRQSLQTRARNGR